MFVAMADFSNKNIGFPSTMWTDIGRWKEASTEEKRDSLYRFYSRYKLPLLKFIQYQGHSASEAEDIFHDFVLNHIEGKIFVNADPTRGRFRNLLLTSLKNFLTSLRRAEYAKKRRPIAGIIGLDDEIVEGVVIKDVIKDGNTPEEIYEKTWLLTILKNVLDRLKKEFQEKDQAVHFFLFEQRVLAPTLYGHEKPSIQKLAKQLNLDASEASNYIVTAKRAYQRHLREEILEYVSLEKEVSEEINDFRYFFQNFNH